LGFGQEKSGKCFKKCQKSGKNRKKVPESGKFAVAQSIFDC
jgi:hypothetical protein